jgi:peroxin-7
MCSVFACAPEQLRFSPFPQETGSRVAIATSQHFGIVGNGELLVADVNTLAVVPVASFETLEGIFDCAWR